MLLFSSLVIRLTPLRRLLSQSDIQPSPAISSSSPLILFLLAAVSFWPHTSFLRFFFILPSLSSFSSHLSVYFCLQEKNMKLRLLYHMHSTASHVCTFIVYSIARKTAIRYCVSAVEKKCLIIPEFCNVKLKLHFSIFTRGPECMMEHGFRCERR